MSRLFASSDYSFGASALASVLPMNIQGLFSLGLKGGLGVLLILFIFQLVKWTL